jgi:hypothetical protein
MEQFDNELIRLAHANSVEWFGKQFGIEMLTETYSSLLKYPKDKDTKQVDMSRPPSFRGKVSNYNNRWDKLEIYNAKSTLVFPSTDDSSPITLIPKLSTVAAVFDVSQIWIIGKTWGCTMKLVQCLVRQRDDEPTGVCPSALSNYVDDSDTEDTNPKKKQKDELHAKVKSEESEPEPEPEPESETEAEAEAEAEAEPEAEAEEAEAEAEKKTTPAILKEKKSAKRKTAN